MGLPARTAGLVAGPPPELRLVQPARGQLSRQRQRLVNRSRQSVVWGLALFALSQLGLACLLEFAHPEIRDTEYWTRLELIQRRTGRSAGNPLSLCFLGSSRSQYGVLANRCEASRRVQ